MVRKCWGEATELGCEGQEHLMRVYRQQEERSSRHRGKEGRGHELGDIARS